MNVASPGSLTENLELGPEALQSQFRVPAKTTTMTRCPFSVPLSSAVLSPMAPAGC